MIVSSAAFVEAFVRSDFVYRNFGPKQATEPKVEVFVYNAKGVVANTATAAAVAMAVAWAFSAIGTAFAILTMAVAAAIHFGAKHSMPTISEDDETNTVLVTYAGAQPDQTLTESADKSFGLDDELFLSQNGEPWAQWTLVGGFKFWANALPTAPVHYYEAEGAAHDRANAKLSPTERMR